MGATYVASSICCHHRLYAVLAHREFPLYRSRVSPHFWRENESDP